MELIDNCDWICKNRSYRGKFNFLPQTEIHINALSSFTANIEVALSGLLLLAAFSQPIGDPYEWPGFIMELWWEGRRLSVTVKLHGAE